MPWITTVDTMLSESQSMNNAQLVANHFIATGWTPNAIAALCGNMRHESSINPNIWEFGYNHSWDRGYGLVQWTPASKYINWAQGQGLEWEAGDSQLARIDYEQKEGIQWIQTSSYPLSFNEFTKSTDDVRYLTRAFTWNYERPNAQAGQDSTPAREAFAVKCLEELDWSGSNVPPGDGTIPTEPPEEKKNVEPLPSTSPTPSPGDSEPTPTPTPETGGDPSTGWKYPPPTDKKYYGGKNMGRKRKMQSWESDISNVGTYDMYFNRLRDYALAMFEWSGLPDEVNTRFLELKMFEDGQVVFYNDPDYGYMAMPVMIGGQINHYGDPTTYEAVSFNYKRSLTPDEAVIIYNNYSRTSLIPVIRAYAYRLYQVEKTMDVNINAQKTPILLLADESQRMTLLQTYMNYEGNEPFIFGNKSGFDKESIQAIETQAPFVSDKLMEYKHNLWNEAMTFLGVGNAKQDKKERLVSDEVSANDEQIQSTRFHMLQARQDACKKINDMFGLNVSVDFKLNLAQQQDEEGQDNEKPEDR